MSTGRETSGLRRVGLQLFLHLRPLLRKRGGELGRPPARFVLLRLKNRREARPLGAAGYGGGARRERRSLRLANLEPVRASVLVRAPRTLLRRRLQLPRQLRRQRLDLRLAWVVTGISAFRLPVYRYVIFPRTGISRISTKFCKLS